MSADITSNLDWHIAFDENTGTTAADTGSAGAGVTLTSSSQWAAPGKVGVACTTYAAASTQNAAHSNVAAIAKNASGATTALWFKTTDTGTNKLMLTIPSGGANARFFMRLSASNAGRIQVAGSAGDAEANQVVETNSTYNDGNWHHLAGVFNYGADTITVYIDGAAVSTTGTVAFTASATSNTNSASPQVIGNWSSGSFYFTGSIDDVRIYSRALTAEEVSALYGLAITPIAYRMRLLAN